MTPIVAVRDPPPDGGLADEGPTGIGAGPDGVQPGVVGLGPGGGGATGV
jgi:hypothetical protein